MLVKEPVAGIPECTHIYTSIRKIKKSLAICGIESSFSSEHALRSPRYVKKRKKTTKTSKTNLHLKGCFIGSGCCHRQHCSTFPPSALLCCCNSPTAAIKEVFLRSPGDTPYALSCWCFISKSHKFTLLLPSVLFPVVNISILPCGGKVFNVTSWDLCYECSNSEHCCKYTLIPD